MALSKLLNLPEPSAEPGVPAPATPPESARGQVLDFEDGISELEVRIHELEGRQSGQQADYSQELHELRVTYTSLLRKTYDNLSAWQTVQVARHPQRPQ